MQRKDQTTDASQNQRAGLWRDGDLGKRNVVQHNKIITTVDSRKF